MTLSDYDQHKADEEYSASMDSVERERARKAEIERIRAENERLMAEAGAYVDAMLSHAADPALAARLLIADRAFLLSCMAGFACQEVARTLGEMRG